MFRSAGLKLVRTVCTLHETKNENSTLTNPTHHISAQHGKRACAMHEKRVCAVHEERVCAVHGLGRDKFLDPSHEEEPTAEQTQADSDAVQEAPKSASAPAPYTPTQAEREPTRSLIGLTAHGASFAFKDGARI